LNINNINTAFGATLLDYFIFSLIIISLINYELLLIAIIIKNRHNILNIALFFNVNYNLYNILITMWGHVTLKRYDVCIGIVCVVFMWLFLCCMCEVCVI
jgi:hypothetical protein